METGARILKSLSYAGLNPLKKMSASFTLKKFGVGLLAHTLEFSESFDSEFSASVCNTERTSVKLNMFFLHSWMLCHRMSSERSFEAFLNKGLLNQVLAEIIKHDLPFLYSNEFDLQILRELQRMKSTVFLSFNDHYLHANSMERPVEDIIF